MSRRGLRRHHDVFDGIARFDRLVAAARRAVRGKRRVPGAAAFMADLEPACLQLERELNAGTWRSSGYAVFRVNDPKPRRISAAPFPDRVVHHAFCAVVEPIFEAGFTPTSFANRKGFGTHAAVDRYERCRDGAAWVLRCDVHRFFPAIDHAILKEDLRRRIACSRTMQLADTIIDGSNPQEPVIRHYPGDDILTPLERRRGLPIGNLTSQMFANVYLDPLDHFIAEKLRCRRHVRYADDFALFHDDEGVLEDWRSAIADFLARRRLSLHPSKTWIAPSREPAMFLGYELHAGGRRRLPRENVRRFTNRLRGLRERWRDGGVHESEVRQRVMAWIAHAERANTDGLRRALFGSGWFNPSALALRAYHRRRRGRTGP